jgi:small subunit ribosomal protein S1
MSEKQATDKMEVNGRWSDAFEKMLGQYDYERPQRGQILDGRIVYVDDEKVLVDVGAKRDAVVPRQDLSFLNQDERENLSPGYQVPVYVLRPSQPNGSDLIVSIARGREREDWDRAKELKTSNEAVELEVVGQNKGGLEVKFGRLRGFVPNSHTPGLRRGMSADQMRAHKQEIVHSRMLFKMLEVDRNRRRLVLSARAASGERRRRALEQLQVGQVIHGQVVGLTDFGAFVDLGEVDGLIHISELDWTRVSHPSEVLHKGDELDVEVQGVDVERERVSLSRKALLPNPWDTIGDRYHVDDLAEGVITKVLKFGAFVALPEGIEGLVHVEEIGIVGPGRPSDVVHEGQTVLARILQLEPARARMDLSLRRVTEEERAAWQVRQASAEPETGEVDQEVAEPDQPVA